MQYRIQFNRETISMKSRKPARKVIFLLTAVLIAFAFLWLSAKSHSIQAIAKNLNAVDTIGAELIQVVNKQSDAWNRGDLVEFMAPYWNDERLTFSSSGKTKRGWKATLKNYQKNYPDRETMGMLTFSDLETQELGSDAILMLGSWHLKRKEPAQGNFSLVWKRIDTKWVIVHDHSSSLEKEKK